jgi:hypothetical protein
VVDTAATAAGVRVVISAVTVKFDQNLAVTKVEEGMGDRPRLCLLGDGKRSVSRSDSDCGVKIKPAIGAVSEGLAQVITGAEGYSALSLVQQRS